MNLLQPFAGAGPPRDWSDPRVRLVGLEADESRVRPDESDAERQLHADV